MAITPHIKYGLFYTELVQRALQERVETGDVYYFERTPRKSEWDHDKVDFIVHKSLDSPPLYLQVKGGARGKHIGSTKRRQIKARGGEILTRHQEREECFVRGVKLLTLQRDSTAFGAWARIWFLLHTEEMCSPSVRNILWDIAERSLERLVREQVIDAYEPKNINVWTVRRGERTVELSLPPWKPAGPLYERVREILDRSLAIA